MDSSGSEYGSRVRCFKRDNETSGFVNGGQFVDQAERLSACQE